MKPPVFNPDWSEEVRALYRHDLQEIWDRSIAPQIWTQYHYQLDLYQGLVGSEPLDVLDVGCAQGTLALMLAEKGHRVTAVDLRSEFLDYARSRYERGEVRFIQANVLADQLEGQFDFVFANQIIEHLVYPSQLVDSLRKLLRPGGRLVVTTPNHSYIKNSLPSYRELGDASQFEHLQNTADGDGHFYAYSAEELASVFANAGMRNIRVQHFETPFISGHMKFRYVHSFAPQRLLRALEKMTCRSTFAARRLSHQLLVTAIR
jgi:SAM-dependent methyltransferase